MGRKIFQDKFARDERVIFGLRLLKNLIEKPV
jgi:hypothetical protein